MLVFRKIWRALLSGNHHSEIRPFALLLTNHLFRVKGKNSRANRLYSIFFVFNNCLLTGAAKAFPKSNTDTKAAHVVNEQ